MFGKKAECLLIIIANQANPDAVLIIRLLCRFRPRMRAVNLLTPAKGRLNTPKRHVDAIANDKMITDSIPAVLRDMIAVNDLRITTATCAVMQNNEQIGRAHV